MARALCARPTHDRGLAPHSNAIYQPFMNAHTPIAMVKVAHLRLDPENPRLGRHFNEDMPSQEDIREEMKNWALDELAVSFIESNFWPQEALVVVEEDEQLVVLEGNRRLAALQFLHEAAKGNPASRRWERIAESAPPGRIAELRSVPCMKVKDRGGVQAYLGFRHVTGIKEWAPAEKASFIAHLIEKEHLTYKDVMRRIGSKTPAVRQHYIAYRLLIQIEGEVSGIPLKHVEDRFSVMYLSLRSDGTRRFLGIDILADPKLARHPIPQSKLKALHQFALWLFGTEEREPLLKDSRQTDTFGKILGSEAAVAYLERMERPLFEVAARIAGSEESNVVEHVEQAAYRVEEALSVAHMYRDSHRLRSAAKRLGSGAMRLIELFPDLRTKIIEEYS